MLSKSQVRCWIVTQGVIGMENQCLGLAQALSLEPEIKRIKLRSPWKQLAPFLRVGLSHAFSEEGDLIAPPFPDLIIASGRAGALACLYASRYSAARGQKTFTVYIQNPVISPSHFDLVAAPLHDRLKGVNVVSTRGSLHRVTPEGLKDEAKKFAPLFDPLPSPRLAVLIGGNSKAHRLTPHEMAPLAAQLKTLAKETGGSLLVTTSRRTGEENLRLLQAALIGVPHFLWDGSGDNPYHAMLGTADAILVTADSVNMTSEACSTGKPVHIIPLAGGSEKFDRFHRTLREDGLTRPFEGKLGRWVYAPLNDVALVAARVRELMGGVFCDNINHNCQ